MKKRRGEKHLKASNSGSGALAQGSGAVAAGEKGIAAGRDVQITNNYYGIQPLPPPPIPNQSPALEPCFLHREEELVWLNDRLHPGKVVAVCGPGGMGKSALAAQAVDKLEAARFPDGIIFHSFYHQPKVETALQAVCAAYQIEAKAGLETAVRAALSGRKALLILDGTEEADNLPALLKMRGACGILITSRKTEDARDELLELKKLDKAQAEEVFRHHSKIAGDDANVAGICKILDGWPVALRIAGQYLRRTKESAAEYLKWLEQEPFKELGSGKHEEENAALLLRRSVDAVSDDARLALGMAGCLAFAPIAREPVAAILDGDERRARAALNELVNYGLLEKREERWQISHALVHTYARTELAMSKESLELLAGWYIAFCKAASNEGVKGYVRLDAERAHCLRLMESCLANELWQEVKRLVGATYIYLDRQCWWTELLAAFAMGLTTAQQIGNRRYEALCLNSLGYTCDSRGEREKALSWYEHSLVIRRELCDRKGEGVTLNNMAMIYQQQGKHKLALQTYQQSLSIQREVGERMGEGTTLNNIGQLYYNQGEHEQALPYYEQCLPIWQELGYKIGEGTTLNNIAAIYYAQSDYAKAMEHYEQALAIAQELGNRDGEARSFWNIGLTYENQSDLAKAEEHMSQAVQIAKDIGHPSLEEWREGLTQVQAARRA
jgi:tetratricopeptide (TPR) repeat protein